MRAPPEYGRLIKTIHILRCMDNPEYHRAIGRQLKKGEQLHNLRRFLFFASEGEIRGSQFEDQTTQVLCLNLAANAIIAWNTVYMAEALNALSAEGIAVDDDDLSHVAPTLWSHVNVYGRYEFDVDAGEPAECTASASPAMGRIGIGRQTMAAGFTERNGEVTSVCP
jgi:hypothetical protein